MVGNLATIRRRMGRPTAMKAAALLAMIGAVGSWMWMVFGSSAISVSTPDGPIPPGEFLLSVQTTLGTAYSGKPPTPAGGGLWGVDLKNGAIRKRADGLANYARVSPDGRSVVFRDDLGATWLGPLGGKLRRLPVEEGRPVWAADGRSLLVSDSRMVRSGNTTEFQPLGHRRLGLDGREIGRLPLPEGAHIHDVSPDGRWLLTTSSDWKVELRSPDGLEARTLSPTGNNDSPRFSPDGRRVAFLRNRFEGNGPVSGLWMVDLDGSGPRLIRDGLGQAQAVSWAPDGSAILVKLYKSLVLVRITGEAVPLDIAVRKPFDLLRPKLNADPDPLYIGTAEWIRPPVAPPR